MIYKKLKTEKYQEPSDIDARIFLGLIPRSKLRGVSLEERMSSFT